jgi:nicotinamidase/pyrazinamidase
MKSTIFWDVDTQYDFMMPDGKLYVPDATDIIPNLEKIIMFARKHEIQIMGSIDYHTLQDEEISDNPDFHETFPPHCLANEPGHEKIPATAPLNPLWIDSTPVHPDELKRMLHQHNGEIYFRKQRFDVFTNPNVKPVMELIQPKKIVVFGVALDVCDAYAMEGFLAMNRFQLFLVTDAVKPIYADKGEKLIHKWKSQGVKMVTTAEVLDWKIG